MSETTSAPAPTEGEQPLAPTDQQPLPSDPQPQNLSPPDPPKPEEPKPDDEAEKLRKRAASSEYEARKAKREVRELAAENERLQRAREAASPDADRERQREVAAEAAKQIRVERFNDECNRIYDEGTKEFGRDFDLALGSFKEIGGLPPELVEAAAETGDAHRVLKYLGENIGEAERLVRLTPARLGAAVAKIAAKAAAAAAAAAAAPSKPVSKAPAPISPIGGAARTEPNLETIPIGDFMKLEDKRESERRFRN